MLKKAYGGVSFRHPSIAPLHRLNDALFLLELWHGPTCAFKDLALQFLPHLLTGAAVKTGERATAVILTATSGDTGKAALEGFRDVPGTRVIVFYPEEGVSMMQQRQMATQEGGNVHVAAVRGNFDDAQAGVKAIFADRDLADKLARHGFKHSAATVESMEAQLILVLSGAYIGYLPEHYAQSWVEQGRLRVLLPALWPALPAIFFTGILSIGVGYTLQVVAQGHTKPADTAILLSLEAVFAVVGGWLVLGRGSGQGADASPTSSPTANSSTRWPSW